MGPRCPVRSGRFPALRPHDFSLTARAIKAILGMCVGITRQMEENRRDAGKAQSAGTVVVKVGGVDYVVDAEARKADAQLVLPFRGLSSVREKGKVTGITVAAMAGGPRGGDGPAP